MQLLDINPFLRYAELQPSVLSSVPFCRAYDYRLFYVLDGEADLVLEDRTLPICAGTLMYFRPNVPYYFSGKVKVIVLNFDMTLNQYDKKEPISPLDTLNCFEPTRIFENDPPEELTEIAVLDRAFEMEEKMQECRSQFCYPTPYSEAISSSIVKEILCYVAERMKKRQISSPPLIQKIRLYVQQNYDRDLDNKQISAEFGYHSYYLNRIFKKNTGITLHQAVIKERIDIAKKLLRNTDISIEEIAEEIGFSDRAQFSTAFKKHTYSTPSEYRKHTERAL